MSGASWLNIVLSDGYVQCASAVYVILSGEEGDHRDGSAWAAGWLQGAGPLPT